MLEVVCDHNINKVLGIGRLSRSLKIIEVLQMVEMANCITHTVENIGSAREGIVNY